MLKQLNQRLAKQWKTDETGWKVQDMAVNHAWYSNSRFAFVSFKAQVVVSLNFLVPIYFLNIVNWPIVKHDTILKKKSTPRSIDKTI